MGSTPIQKRSSACIKNFDFLHWLLQSLPLQGRFRFHRESRRMIEALEDEQDDYSLSLLKSARVGWIWQPVIYWPENVFTGSDFARWLQHITHSKIFEYRGDGECNPLWFSEQTFQPFAKILANQFEIAIEGYYLGHQKSLEELQNFQQYLLKNNKHHLVSWLEIPLLQMIQKPQDELEKIRQKMRIEQERMAAINSENILLEMQRLNETIKKSKRRRKKKQQVYSNGSSRKEDEAEIKSAQPFVIDEQITNTMSLSEQSTVIEQNTVFTITEAEAEEVTEYLTEHIEQYSKRKFSYHSDHQESTNQNERSDSKEKMIMHGEPLCPLEQMPEQKIQRRRKRKGRKQRQEKQLWEELKTLVSHRFITRHLEAASESINTLTNQKLEARMAAFERVRIFTQNNFPFSNAVLFGSNAIGLALPSSDVDVLLVGFTCSSREECGQLLSHLGYLLSYMGWIASCQVFPSAKVPVLRLEIDWRVPFMQLKGSNINPEGGQLVKVDITVHLEGCSSKGYESTALMKSWLDAYPYAQKILVLLKNLLAKFDLNENYRGGIGSYCLFVMILAYLHSHKPELEGEELSVVFQKLLRWYLDDFDGSKFIVWLREEGSCFVGQQQYAKLLVHEERNGEQRKTDDRQRRGALKLIDPTTNTIMSGSCSEYYRVKDLFSTIVFQFSAIESNIEEILRSSNQSPSELSKCFQNRKQSQRWFRRFNQQMGATLHKVLGLGQ